MWSGALPSKWLNMKFSWTIGISSYMAMAQKTLIIATIVPMMPSTRPPAFKHSNWFTIFDFMFAFSASELYVLVRCSAIFTRSSIWFNARTISDKHTHTQKELWCDASLLYQILSLFRSRTRWIRQSVNQCTRIFQLTLHQTASTFNFSTVSRISTFQSHTIIIQNMYMRKS